MRWSGIWLLVLLSTMMVIDGYFASAKPSRRSEMMFKALKELEDLEQKYSSVARPSVRSGPSTQADMGPKVQRAINMLRIQHLDRLYSDRARPRFGKRAELENFAVVPDYEGQFQSGEADDWLPTRR